LKEKLPFFILSAIIIIVTLYTPNIHEASSKVISPALRIANAPVVFVAYLVKTFWPYDLAAFYPFSDQIPVWKVWGAVFLIGVISAAVIAESKRLPYLFAGWLWYAVTIAPVTGIIQISSNAQYSMADRYHYLTSIGIAVMTAWGIESLFKSEDMRKKILFPAAAAMLAGMAAMQILEEQRKAVDSCSKCNRE